MGDYCLVPSETFFSYIMAITSYNFIKWWWWCLHCTRPTRWIGLL